MAKSHEEHKLLISETEKKLETAMDDSRYYMEQYTAEFKGMDSNMKSLTTNLRGRMDEIEFSMSRKTS